MIHFTSLLSERPSAEAIVAGSADHPSISGSVRLYQTEYGTLVAAEISGLPDSDDPCTHPVFGFHIHSGMSCTGNESDPFADALGHYNPFSCPHPYHSGDLPPLFGNGGYAYSVFLTDRFTVDDVLGRVVIIHSNPDDFTTQPAGNSGTKIACGKIEAVW